MGGGGQGESLCWDKYVYMADPIYYSKVISGGTDNTLILAPRQGLLLPFSVVENWTILRIGMYASWTSANGDNASVWTSDETTGGSNANDKFYFGIKTNDSGLPYSDGVNFAGILSRPGYTTDIVYTGGRVKVGQYSGSNMSSGVLVGASYAAVSIGGSTTMVLPAPSASSGMDSYATFIGVQFTIANAGLSSQTVSVGTLSSIDTGDTSSQSLLGQINVATNTHIQVGNFVSGGVALSRPDSIFVRIPFTGHRLRIHSIGCVAYET